MLIFLLACGLALFAYRGISDIMPAGDDLTAVLDIQRGNEKGVWAFFTHPPVVKNYRPLQSVLTWAAGNATDSRLWGLHALHVVSLWSLIGVVVLWARTMGLSRWGVAGAAVLTAVHPGLAGQVSDLDTFACMLCPALMWLAAWVLFVWRDRLLLAVPVAAVIFVVAVGFKEYVFGLMTLGALVVFWFKPDKRWLSAIVVGAVFAVLIAASMYVRRFVTPDDAAVVGGAAEVALPSIGLSYVPKNLALYTLALLLPFNTVWVHEHQGQMATYAAVGAGILSVLVVLGVGVWARVRAGRAGVGGGGGGGVSPPSASSSSSSSSFSPPPPPSPRPNRDEDKDDDEDEGGESSGAGFSALWWVGFLLLAAPAATFPNNVLAKVSESYLSAPMVVLALLTGLSIDGWRTRRMPWRVVGGLAGAAVLVSSLVTIRYKAQAVRECGLLADMQFRQILSFVPPGASNKKIATIFFNKDFDTRRTYSVYRMDYDIPAFDPIGLDWYRPGMKLRTQQLGVDRLEQFDHYGYDLAVVWNMETKSFKQLPRPGR